MNEWNELSYDRRTLAYEERTALLAKALWVIPAALFCGVTFYFYTLFGFFLK